MIADSDTALQHLLVPIATLYPLTPEVPEAPSVVPTNDAAPAPVEAGTDAMPGTTGEAQSKLPEPAPNALAVPILEQGWTVRIDFWYMSKRIKRFVPVVPDVWANDRLPGLPPISWHLAQPRRFDQEYDLLKEGGFTVDVVRWDADGKPPFEICFSVYRPGNSHVVLLVTSHDYPATMPALRIAPLVPVEEGEDLFERLYHASRPVMNAPEWTWDSKRTLVELVWYIEKLFKEGVKL
jgi:hypothetical protein